MKIRVDTEQPTVQRILDAATKVFAERGFGGARIDEIAKRANANKTAIYYHIGGKEVLYTEVLRSILENTAVDISKEIQEAHTPEEKLRIYIRILSREIQSRPNIAALMLREMASVGAYLPEEVFRESAKLVEILTSILKEGEQQGVFISIPPYLLHMILIGANTGIQSGILTIRQKEQAFPEKMRDLSQISPEDVVNRIEMLILRAIKK
jgi:AcrR family transcriptional regulator